MKLLPPAQRKWHGVGRVGKIPHVEELEGARKKGEKGHAQRLPGGGRRRRKKI